MRNHSDTMDVDHDGACEHDDTRSERQRPFCPNGADANGSARNADAVVVTVPGSAQHDDDDAAVDHDDLGRSSSSSPPPPPPTVPAVAGAGGMPSFMSGAPSWFFAHQLMSSLFGDQQQQQQPPQRMVGGEGGTATPAAVASDVVTPTILSSSSLSSTMATGTTVRTSSTVRVDAPTWDISQQFQKPFISLASSSSPPPSSASLTAPILQHNKRQGEMSDDIQNAADDDHHHHKDNNNNCSRGIEHVNHDGNNNKATNVIALTRTHFSSPESRRSRYHPLHDDDHDEYIYEDRHRHRDAGIYHHHGSMGGGDSTGEGSLTLETSNHSSDLLLKHTYPLTLQRSASSAFGCPYSSSSSSSFCTFKTRARVRTLSNSGYSDPGASAFRPVWK